MEKSLSRPLFPSSQLYPCLFLPADCLHTQDELMELLASCPFHHKMSALANLHSFFWVLKGTGLRKDLKGVMRERVCRLMINTFKHIDVTVCSTHTCRPLSVGIHGIFCMGGQKVDTHITFPSPVQTIPQRAVCRVAAGFFFPTKQQP